MEEEFEFECNFADCSAHRIYIGETPEVAYRKGIAAGWSPYDTPTVDPVTGKRNVPVEEFRCPDHRRT